MDQLIKHATLVPSGLYNASQALVMKQAKFDSLDAEDRDAILKVSGEVTSRRAGQAWNAEDARANKTMSGRNMSVVNVPPQFVADLQEKTNPIVQGWLKSVSAKGLDGEKVLADQALGIPIYATKLKSCWEPALC